MLSITGFGAAIGLIFTSENEPGVADSLLRAPVEVAAGLGVGLLAGSLCAALASTHRWLRFAVLAGSGLAAVYGGWAIGFAGGGSLAAMTIGAIAARRWEERATHTAQTLGRTWSAAQPMLFGLIGAAVALDTVEPSYVRGGLAVLTVGLLARLLVTYFSVSAKRFTTGERLFVAMAWIPKATVQAAIGALALDLARQNNAGQQAENYGTQVVTVAVLAILLTAPLGAIGIAWSGPRWLQRGEPTRRG